MKAFVTGGTGFLGTNLIRQLLERGYRVRALARSSQKARKVLAGLDLEIVEGDMGNVADFAVHLTDCEMVFHTAAYFREYYQPGDHWPTLEAINITGTVQLLEAAERAGVRRVVYTSSSGAIGMKADGSSGDESTPAAVRQLRNLYFRSKVEADRAVERFLENHDLEVVTVMPGWMHGPGDAAPTDAGKLVLQLLGRKLPGLLDGGSSTVDVRDVAHGIVAAAERAANGDRYILGGRYVSFQELATTLERVAGVPAPRMLMPPFAVESLAWITERIALLTNRPASMTLDGVRTLQLKHSVTSERAIRELNASFRPLEETLRDAVTWFEQNGYVEPRPAKPFAVSS